MHTPRAALFLLAAFFAAFASAWAAEAADLVMYERDGCSWCVRWHKEIGAGYAHSEEGKRAGLRVVNMDRGPSIAVSLKSPVTYTPTFILVDNGREIGRIVGYPGAEFFYGLLAELLKQMDQAFLPAARRYASVLALEGTAGRS